MELGFTSTVGIIHDGDGQLRPLGPREREVFLEMKKLREEALLAAELLPGKYRKWQAAATGAAALAPATFTSAKTAWCITAPSSADFPRSR